MRKIIHIDMDAFYASVEQLDDPSLRGRPVLVGGPPTSRGVVAAASYEARAFGVRSAMPSSQAARQCPQAVFVAPRFTRYREVSQQLHGIFHRYTDVVEPLSLDEAYLDVTENLRDIPYATTIAQEIRSAVRDELGLTASAGVAPNKFLAKVASDVNKPDGLCVVRPGSIERFLRELPVARVPGVGPRTAERLRALGIESVPDLLRVGETELVRQLGRQGAVFLDFARGIDERPVRADQVRKSLSIEDTFERDIVSIDEVRLRLESLADGLETRMKKTEARGRTVTLKIKYHDFRSSTRSRTLPQLVDNGRDALAVALELLSETEVGSVPVRLLGLGISQLDDPSDESDGPKQLPLPFVGER